MSGAQRKAGEATKQAGLQRPSYRGSLEVLEVPCYKVGAVQEPGSRSQGWGDGTLSIPDEQQHMHWL